jgi:hypothetical protein
VSLNRYIIKQAAVYLVYDRLTGSVVGRTIATTEVVKRVLTPRGLMLDERIESGTEKIAVGTEDAYHKAVSKILYQTDDDKRFEESSGENLQ